MALAWVATGQRAAYVTDRNVRDSVHFAAGLAICEAAGCRVTDVLGHAWGSGATGLVAAADPETHAALLRLVRKFLSNSTRSTVAATQSFLSSNQGSPCATRRAGIKVAPAIHISSSSPAPYAQGSANVTFVTRCSC